MKNAMPESFPDRPRNEEHIPGEIGVWLLIFGEITFFLLLFSAFLFTREQNLTNFKFSQDELTEAIGVSNTLLLLTSSLLVAKGVAATRDQEVRLAPQLFLGALICALGFVVLKALEYTALISKGIRPVSGDFFSFYFILTGLHLAHVLAGSVLLSILAVASRTPITKKASIALVESVGCFWHMVDLLWIMIFALLYLVK